MQNTRAPISSLPLCLGFMLLAICSIFQPVCSGIHCRLGSQGGDSWGSSHGVCSGVLWLPRVEHPPRPPSRAVSSLGSGAIKPRWFNFDSSQMIHKRWKIGHGEAGRCGDIVGMPGQAGFESQAGFQSDAPLCTGRLAGSC